MAIRTVRKSCDFCGQEFVEDGKIGLTRDTTMRVTVNTKDLDWSALDVDVRFKAEVEALGLEIDVCPDCRIRLFEEAVLKLRKVFEEARQREKTAVSGDSAKGQG